MTKRILLITLISLMVQSSFSQVIPPGMGKTNLINWVAGSIKTDIDTVKNWNSNSYIGIGTSSHPDNYNPFQKMKMLVVNQAFQHKFGRNWSVSVEAMYARENRYDSNAPFEVSSDPIKHEFRLYGRLSYTWKIGKRVELTPTYRQEFQKYFAHDFKNANETFRHRSRFRIKLGINVSTDRRHKIILFSEQLFSSSFLLSTQKWTSFQYKDSRFALYYSVKPKHTPITLNIGYMNNLIGTKKPWFTHFVALDVVWKIPYRK